VLVNFKTVLAARGMRQIELALDLKISPTVLSEIVNGRRTASPSLRARLADMLQADEAWLFSSFTRIPKREDSATGASVRAACVGEPA
jgi:transcriptional regulator with XRE-family HTH domain